MVDEAHQPISSRICAFMQVLRRRCTARTAGVVLSALAAWAAAADETVNSAPRRPQVAAFDSLAANAAAQRNEYRLAAMTPAALRNEIDLWPPGTASDGTRANEVWTGEVLELHSVEIDEDGLLTVVYSKNFPDCTDLVDSDSRKTHSNPGFFCAEGSQISETHDLYDISLVRNEVQLCRRGDHTWCSDLIPISAPAHRLVFYLDCDLARDLADRMELPFECVAPSEELMSELGRRLSSYARDLQTVFAKRTVRRFTFDPAADVVLTETRPHSGSCCGNPQPKPFSHELWISARQTDRPSFWNLRRYDELRLQWRQCRSRLELGSNP